MTRVSDERRLREILLRFPTPPTKSRRITLSISCWTNIDGFSLLTVFTTFFLLYASLHRKEIIFTPFARWQLKGRQVNAVIIVQQYVLLSPFCEHRHFLFLVHRLNSTLIPHYSISAYTYTLDQPHYYYQTTRQNGTVGEQASGA